MSAADAWDEYEHLNYAEEPDMEHVERAFMAGYRRALLDFRDSVHASIPATTILMHPPLVSVLKRLTVLAEQIDRAAAPDPRETKD